PRAGGGCFSGNVFGRESNPRDPSWRATRSPRERGHVTGGFGAQVFEHERVSQQSAAVEKARIWNRGTPQTHRPRANSEPSGKSHIAVLFTAAFQMLAGPRSTPVSNWARMPISHGVAVTARPHLEVDPPTNTP